MARFIHRFAICTLTWLGSLLAAVRAETLYNGIELPDLWPPRLAELPDALPVPPYLRQPPKVIPIDLGRQLFVDDFLIEKTDMTRTFHRPAMFPGNPVVKPDKEWEMQGQGPMALPLSVFWDPADGKFKMWYLAGYVKHLCQAVSEDGITWTKPDLGDGRNVAGPAQTRNIVIDPNSGDPGRRYKLLELNGGARGTVNYRYSADGVRWSSPQWASGQVWDATTWFHNPFRSKWIISVRHSSSTITRGRIRRYWEFDDVDGGRDANWGNNVQDAPLWVGADRPHDAPRPELAAPVQLYRLNCEAYESLLLGTFTIYRGNFAHESSDGRPFDTDRPKCNEICIGYTRDGFHWYRPDYRPWIGLSERRGDWNWGNLWSCGPGMVVVGDYLYIYAAGRAGKSVPGSKIDDAGGSAGLAFLRRDGFVSMNADAIARTITTRTVRFTGKRLFVNVDAAKGELRVEVLDENGRAIPPFTRENCTAIKANDTIRAVTWKGASDLGKVAGKEVKIRVHLTNGRLYSLWVSPDECGASNGYLTAGGPGIKGFKDTTGKNAYERNRLPLVSTSPHRSVRDADGDGSAEVSLDASGSTDPDGRITEYTWLCGGKQIATGATPKVKLPVGTHMLTLVVTDDHGASGYGRVDIEVKPNVDPEPLRNNMVMWVKADAINGLADGAPVVRWVDSSGNRYDPEQNETARRPVWKKTAANGRPAVRFDGQDDYLLTQFVRGLTLPFGNVTLFAVFKPEGEVRGSVVGQDFNTLYVSSDDGGLMGFGAGTGGSMKYLRTKTPGAIQAGRWYVASMVRAGTGKGDSRLFINGRQDDNQTALHYHNINSSAGHIGCARGGHGLFQGDIAEIIVYAGALPNAERRKVEAYLGRKYGIRTPSSLRSKQAFSEQHR